MKKLMHILVGLCIFSTDAFSQNPWELSGEYQHGFGKNYNENIIGARYEGYGSSKSSWSLGFNYTFSSLHIEKETAKGHGFGLYAGYRYGLSYGLSGNLFAGARASFTFNKDEKGNKYSVLMPSIETGYHYTAQDFGKGGAFTPFVSFGYKFKIGGDEKAKTVYQGTVFSPGISLGYRF